MGHGFMSGRMDPADIDRRVDKMSGYFAKEVNATDDQRSKLAVIAKAAAKDMLPMRETIRDARKQARALLSQPVIDKSAVETLRAAQIANADALSKRLSAAVTEAAEVLTPEQRKQLSERMAKHEGWLDGGDRG